MSDGGGNRVLETGPGPMGPTRMSGDEAVTMGLVNRLTAPGQALRSATELAQRIATFPKVALATEYHYGINTIASGETIEGASRFAAGPGRHGHPPQLSTRRAALAPIRDKVRLVRFLP